MIKDTWLVDDTIISEFFGHNIEAKFIFSFFRKRGIKAKIASNIHKRLFENAQISKNDKTKLRFDSVLESFGDGSYDGVDFKTATVNMVNLHSDLGTVQFITNESYPSGDNDGGMLVERGTLVTSTLEETVSMIHRFDPEFAEWHDSLALLHEQKMDPEAKADTVSGMVSKKI